jgi:hypothetical protein
MRRADRLVRFVVAACAAFAETAHAQDVSILDAAGVAARLGVIGKAERIVHHDKPYLLVQLTIQNARMVDLGGGRTDWVLVGEGQRSFLPLAFDCDAASLDADGKRVKALPLSVCSGTQRIDAPFAAPVFLVFPLPRPGPAKFSIPVKVSPPAPPVARRRDEPAPGAPSPAVADLLGERDIVLGLGIPAPR